MQIEKIKTIGDAYMAAAGLSQPRPGQTAAIAEFAFAMLATLEQLNRTLEIPFQVRIGIHTGLVIAGVIGVNKFIYDVWGDTVNLASRLEAHGLPGRIHISEATRQALAADYECEPRGLINVKGMGQDGDRLLRQPQARRRARGRSRPRRSPCRDAERRLTGAPDRPGTTAVLRHPRYPARAVHSPVAVATVLACDHRLQNACAYPMMQTTTPVPVEGGVAGGPLPTSAGTSFHGRRKPNGSAFHRRIMAGVQE